MTEKEQQEFWASLALRHTKGVGPRTWKRLLEHYPTPYAAVMDEKNWTRLKLTNNKQAETFRTQAWREPAKIEWELKKHHGYSVLLWCDDAYPEHLRQIPDPPILLYFQGDQNLLSSPCVAMVGTRKSTDYGRDATRDIALALSQAGVTIVSGLAYGIDRQAHLAGLEGVGKSIAVIGAGLDKNYPAGNSDVREQLARHGLIVTELMPGTAPEPRHFPVRNRIISGLSLGVIVVEASLPSGSMITARQALDQGREVFAVPGPRGSTMHKGCFELINQGAKLVCTAEDVLSELAPLLKDKLVDLPPATESQAVAQTHAPSSAPPKHQDDVQEYTPDEKALLSRLQNNALHIDALGESLAWTPGKVSSTLLLLEMRGQVRQLPGMVYCLPSS